MDNEKFNKLPKWAQNKITQLTNNLESANKRISEIDGKGETNTFINEGLTERPLPNNTQITFVNGKCRISAYLQKDGSLNINGDSRDSRDMVILPRASNSIYITFIERT